MALEDYGVLKGYVVSRRSGRSEASPYYQIHVSDGIRDFRVQIKVKSDPYPSNIKYLIADDFRHPLLNGLEELELGFTELEHRPGSVAIDYIRLNPLDIDDLIKIEPGGVGPGGGFAQQLEHYVLSAMEEEEAMVYVFGQAKGPFDAKDRYFGFSPSCSIQNVHQNQGSYVKFRRENGVWQDGALFFHSPRDNRWTAVFVAFQSQSRHTDDNEGQPIGPEPLPIPESYDDGEIPDIPEVFIAGATLHYDGASLLSESVTLLNVTNKPVDLDGFAIADFYMNKEVIPKTIIEPGQFLTIKLSGKCAVLSNRGGIITLLDPRGLKVHGVFYNREDIKYSQWTLRF